MYINPSEKLFHNMQRPKGLVYKLLVSYTLIVTVFVLFMAYVHKNESDINLYFIVNLCSVLILLWFISKSFNIESKESFLKKFRAGLFLLLNSTLASMSGGLQVIDVKDSSLLAAVLYIPAIFLIIYSFNKFILFANVKYQNAIELSLTDELTGLPNRRHLNIILRELESNQATIGIVDLDDFKEINDTYGHEVGDKVLKNAGFLLRKMASKEIFISRTGGEEFAILIREGEDEKSIIQKVKQSLSSSSFNGILTTVSIGVAFKRSNQTSSCALAAADLALYEAKRNGKNRITYSKE